MSWIVALAFAFLPGAAIVFGATRGERGMAGRVGLALALSPGLVGAGTALYMAAGLGLRPAAAAAVTTWLVLGAALAWTRQQPARTAPSSVTSAIPGERRTFLFALATVAACGALPLVSEWWRLFADAWVHEGIVRAIARDGLPPGDPWYAGLTLHYAWVYHVEVAALRAWTGLDVFALMAFLAALSAGALVLCAGDLAARLNGRHVGTTLALLVLGLNALFPLFALLLLARAFTGDVRGWSEVAALFDLRPFGWDTVGPFLRSLGGQDFFLNKFTVATPLSLALAAFVAWLSTLARVQSGTGPQRGNLLLAALGACTAGLFHPVVGIAIVVLAAAAGLTGVLGWTPPGTRGNILAWTVAGAAGMAPAAWYIASFVRTGAAAQGPPPLDLNPLKWMGLVSCTALGLLLALRSRRAATATANRPWLAIVVASLVLALVIRLPGPSPFYTVDKLSYVLWIPLAILAGPALGDLLRQRRPWARALLLALLFAPVNGLALLSRTLDPHTWVRQPWDRPAFRWMREHLPADAVLITPPGDTDVGVFSQRDQYYAYSSDAQLRGYATEPMAARRDLVGHFYESGRLSEAELNQLAGLRRPVFAVLSDFRQPFWATTPAASLRQTGASVRRLGAGEDNPILFADEDATVVGVIP